VFVPPGHRLRRTDRVHGTASEADGPHRK
jgi:hypothetical protein